VSELGEEHAPTRTSGLAIASLALGVIGFLAVPLVASALAIALGRSAEREIARDPLLGGEGLARAGVILGWIGVALAAMFVFLVLIIAI
jgi:Domain of unknown function (DUF4190)